MSDVRPVLALTVGEPAGIGPEISLRAAWQLRDSIRSVLIGDAAYLAMLAGEIDPAIRVQAVSVLAARNGGLPVAGTQVLSVIDCPLAHPVKTGHLDSRNARAVLNTLDVAIESIQSGWCQGMVTAPLQKSTINDAGIPFSGHTEYLAEKTGTEKVVMMLACEAGRHLSSPLRVALATTHLPLKDVADAITQASLAQIFQIVQRDLQQRFGLRQPRILVAGLNPHAGENGYLGHEEIDTIIPAIQAAQQAGMAVSGPYPADTLFQEKYLQHADCILAMYHDQGLPVLKHASFGQGVNITLGLPLIRTSVDHGTALDLAVQGTGHADSGSMQVAMRVAASMVRASTQL
jgi:4-hydroxythreonine-4-phosphate dehydrogenase